MARLKSRRIKAARKSPIITSALCRRPDDCRLAMCAMDCGCARKRERKTRAHKLFFKGDHTRVYVRSA